MQKIFVLVEGETEQTFVKGTLVKYLHSKGIYPQAVIVNTRIVKQGKNFKGGVISYGKVKNDLRRLLLDSSAHLITTMFDFYAIPHDFPKYEAMPNGTCYERVHHLEKAFYDDIGNPRFLPYLSLHEYEAMLFTSPQAVARACGNEKLSELQKIKANYQSPEEINEQSPPSKRLKNLYEDYDKLLHEYYIVDEIGIEAIRAVCPHFHQWLMKIEKITTEQEK